MNNSINKIEITANKTGLVLPVGSGVEWCRVEISETSHLSNK